MILFLEQFFYIYDYYTAVPEISENLDQLNILNRFNTTSNRR